MARRVSCTRDWVVGPAHHEIFCDVLCAPPELRPYGVVLVLCAPPRPSALDRSAFHAASRRDREEALGRRAAQRRARPKPQQCRIRCLLQSPRNPRQSLPFPLYKHATISDRNCLSLFSHLCRPSAMRPNPTLKRFRSLLHEISPCCAFAVCCRVRGCRG